MIIIINIGKPAADQNTTMQNAKNAMRFFLLYFFLLLLFFFSFSFFLHFVAAVRLVTEHHYRTVAVATVVFRCSFSRQNRMPAHTFHMRKYYSQRKTDTNRHTLALANGKGASQ